MKIPDKVKIGYKDIKVLKTDGDVIDGTTLCYGVIRHNDCIIEISTKYADDVQKCALIHEIIHGIDDIFNIDLREEQVDQLAKGLYQVIKDNPDVFTPAP
ncbi:hypothetical protein [Thermoanaerobacterium sp. DL9XJH110]|uniref:hypothetical protein n=1 Tax=Thermoanaerobacterium sp. DL9XJH110 TaxID=3386643 RepID=UPI003BB6399E